MQKLKSAFVIIFLAMVLAVPAAYHYKLFSPLVKFVDGVVEVDPIEYGEIFSRVQNGTEKLKGSLSTLDSSPLLKSEINPTTKTIKSSQVRKTIANGVVDDNDSAIQITTLQAAYSQFTEDGNRLQEDLNLLSRSGNAMIEKVKKKAEAIQNAQVREVEYQRIEITRQQFQKSINQVKTSIKDVKKRLVVLHDLVICADIDQVLGQVNSQVLAQLKDYKTQAANLLASMDSLNQDAQQLLKD